MSKQCICANCGRQGQPKTQPKGSFLIGLLLWIFFIIPGVIYTLWCFSNRVTGCPYCGAPNMIPLDSPKGQQIAMAALPVSATAHP